MVFHEFVDLSGTRFERSLRLEGCEFRRGLALSDALVGEFCSLQGSTFDAPDRLWLDFRRLTVKGLLDCSNVTSRVGLILDGFRGEGDVWFNGADLRCAMRSTEDADSAAAHWPADAEQREFCLHVRGRALSLMGASIGQGLFLRPTRDRRVTSAGCLDLRCAVGQQVVLDHVKVDAILGSNGDRAVHMDSASVGGNVVIMGRSHLTGVLDLRGKIGGQVELIGETQVDAPGATAAVNLEKAEVGGSVLFRGGVRINGGINVRAKVGGQVVLVDCKVVGPKDLSVTLAGADVGGDLVFRNCELDGQLRLRSAKVGGRVSFHEVKLRRRTRESTIALAMRETTVGLDVEFFGTLVVGRVDMRARVGGEVKFERFKLDAADLWDGEPLPPLPSGDSAGEPEGALDLRARVEGDVVFKHSEVRTPSHRQAIDMHGADVRGSVYVVYSNVVGQVDLRASVGRQVKLIRSTIAASVTDQPAVTLNEGHVGGTVFVRHGTQIDGGLDLRAKIDGSVVIRGSVLDAKGSRLSLDLEDATVGGAVIIRDDARFIGDLDMRRATIGGGVFTCKDTRARQFHYPTPGDAGRHVIVHGRWEMDFADVNGPVLLHGVSLFGEFHGRHLTVQGDLDFCAVVCGSSAADARDECASLCREAKAGVWSEPEAAGRAVHVKNRPDGTPVPAIDLELAEVHGRLWIRSTRVLGSINLEDAEIDGEANFDQSMVECDLMMRSAVVKGRVFADEISPGGHAAAAPGDGTPSDGRERFASYPRVKGHIELAFANLQQVDIKFEDEASTPAYIDLSGAKVGSIRLAGRLGKYRPFLVVEGTEFESINVGGLQPDPNLEGERRKLSRSDWARIAVWVLLVGTTLGLAYAHGSGGLLVMTVAYGALTFATHYVDRYRRADRKFELLSLLQRTYPFNQGFYVRVERWLREGGDDATADEAFLERRRVEARPAKLPPLVFLRHTRRRPSPPADVRRTLERWWQPVDPATGLPGRPRPILLFERALRAFRNGWSRRAAATVENERQHKAWLAAGEAPVWKYQERPRPHTFATGVWFHLINFAFGYGVRTSRLMHAFVLLWLLNTAVFLNPDSVERPVTYVQARDDGRLLPKPDRNSPNPWPADGGYPDPANPAAKAPQEWSTHHAFFFTSRVQIPILNLMAEDDWQASSRPIWGGEGLSYENYASIMMVINLILIPIIVAGMTGHLKK